MEYCRAARCKGLHQPQAVWPLGMLPHWKDEAGYSQWRVEGAAFGKAIREVLGERRNPRMVFEHPGESTVPTSIFVCEQGVWSSLRWDDRLQRDRRFRYLWTRQKRLQGSHFAQRRAGACVR